MDARMTRLRAILTVGFLARLLLAPFLTHTLCLMTDDAIPASTNLLRDMMKVLESDGRIVAASGRQIPRSDADLMACQAIWGTTRCSGWTATE